MRIDWPMVVLVAVLVGASVGAFALGSTELAMFLAGAAVGFLPRRGVVGAGGIKFVPLALALALGSQALACGSAIDDAQLGLDVATRAVVAADTVGAEYYTDRADDCLGPSDTPEQYRECMRPAEDVRVAIKTAADSVLAGQAGLDTWRRIDDDAEFAVLAACIVVDLDAVIRLLVDVGVDVPDPVVNGLALIAPFGGACGDR